MHTQSQSSPTMSGKTEITNIRVTGGHSGDREERVSLAPRSPEDALRGPLATPPLDEADDQE